MVLKLRESQLAQLQRNVPISDSQEIASLREGSPQPQAAS